MIETYLFSLLHQLVQLLEVVRLRYRCLLQFIKFVPELSSKLLSLIVLHPKLNWISTTVYVLFESFDSFVRPSLCVPESLDLSWVCGFLNRNVVDRLELRVLVRLEDAEPLIDVPFVVWMREVGEEKSGLHLVERVEVCVEPCLWDVYALSLEFFVILSEASEDGLLFENVFFIWVVNFVGHAAREEVQGPCVDTKEEDTSIETIVIFACHPVDVLEVRRWFEDLERDFLVHNNRVGIEVTAEVSRISHKVSTGISQ